MTSPKTNAEPPLSEEAAPVLRPMRQVIFITKGDGRLRVLWRILGQILLMLFFFALLVSLLPALVAVLPFLGFLNDANLIAFLAVTPSVYLARRWFDKRSLAGLGLDFGNLALKDVLSGIGIAGLMMALIFSLHSIFGWVRIESFAWQQVNAGEILITMAYYAFAFILVGWTEELLFRGYYLRNLTRGLNLTAAALITSAVFAVGHRDNPNADLFSMIGLLLAGLFFVFAYLRSQSLWLPIGIHIGWNFFEGPVLGFPVSGLIFKSLLESQVSGPDLLTGGAFGPEAGLVLLPALALGLWLIHNYARTRVTER